MKETANPGQPLVRGPNRAQAAISLLPVLVATLFTGVADCAELRAGVAKVDITDEDAGPVNDRLYVKALVLDDGANRAAIITVDAVAIAEIGTIKNDYLVNVRSQLEKELRIIGTNVLINASHCHGRVHPDVEQRTIQAVKKAAEGLVPVKVGAGSGHEDRIMENRRLILKNGKEADVRHAYSLPPDEQVAAVGPVDPGIGLLRLDKKNDETLAVVYNFACHPIQGVPGGGNTADITGFASRVIEDNLGNGAVALFLQGCAGDINPILYKDVDHPRDAEPLGNQLGLSTLKALRTMRASDCAELRVANETLELPRADLAPRIESMESEMDRLLASLQGTSLNLKTFLQLFMKHGASAEYPSQYSHRYLQDEKRGKNHWRRLDAESRMHMAAYVRNIHIMEELTRKQINLALLKKHHARNQASGSKTIQVEVMGLRIGDFRLVSFPGEPSVQVGLNIKKMSPHEHTFVAGYSNGYIYYAPTAEQLRNLGGAQEDSDCLLAPGWQKIFETRALEILNQL